MTQEPGPSNNGATWPSEIENELLTEDRFTEIYAAQLRLKLPGVTVTITDTMELEVDDPQSEGTSVEWLGNLWNSCAAAPGQRAGACESFQRASAAALLRARQMDDAVAIGDVLPVVKHEEMVAKRAGETSPDKLLACEKFIGDLYVFLVADYPESLRYLTMSDIEKLGMTFSAALKRAQRNLIDGLQVKRLDTEKEIYMLKVDGNYEASLMLLDDVWDRLANAGNHPGNFIVSVPTRDVLMYCSSEHPDMIEVMRATINNLFRSDTPYPLSRKIYERVDGQWRVFDDNPARRIPGSLPPGAAN